MVQPRARAAFLLLDRQSRRPSAGTACQRAWSSRQSPGRRSYLRLRARLGRGAPHAVVPCRRRPLRPDGYRHIAPNTHRRVRSVRVVVDQAVEATGYEAPPLALEPLTATGLQHPVEHQPPVGHADRRAVDCRSRRARTGWGSRAPPSALSGRKPTSSCQPKIGSRRAVTEIDRDAAALAPSPPATSGTRRRGSSRAAGARRCAAPPPASRSEPPADRATLRAASDEDRRARRSRRLIEHQRLDLAGALASSKSVKSGDR